MDAWGAFAVHEGTFLVDDGVNAIVLQNPSHGDRRFLQGDSVQRLDGEDLDSTHPDDLRRRRHPSRS
jgi:hypothetical protein